MKHTQGKWEVNASGQASKHYREFVVNDENEIIAYCHGDSREEAEANAKLISAAPDLLEALQTIADCENTQLDKRDALSFIKVARATIKKATT